ncbi:MAG: hypothetical protein ACI8YQ_000959 [Polaribacter sp.]|jgi:hypothetical protein
MVKVGMNIGQTTQAKNRNTKTDFDNQNSEKVFSGLFRDIHTTPSENCWIAKKWVPRQKYS